MTIQESHSRGSYAILPSFIMDDENLDEGAKILYARISMYSQDGRCWASNAHFAEKQKVTIRCIQNWLKQLIDNEYIEVEIEKGGFQTKRNIWITTDFKKSYTKRTVVHVDVQPISCRDEVQFTHINTREINIKENNISTTTTSDNECNNGGGGEEKKDFGEINYTTASGKHKQTSESEIYRHFVDSGVPPEILKEAIAQLRSCRDPIGSVMKYLEAICRRISLKKNKPQINLTKINPNATVIITSDPLSKEEFNKRIEERRKKNGIKK